MRLSLFIVLFSLLCSCQQTQGYKIESRSQEVPALFISVTDSNFSIRQDTLFYEDKRFCGNLYGLSPGRDTVLLESYLNGLKEGICKRWYENKQLQEERFYIAGVKEGLHVGWWENGKPQYQFGISKDAYEGTFKAWNHEGLLIKDFHYRNGQEEGRQVLWYDDGKIKANYIIKNGRRYGLLGTKNCVNVSDSLFKK